MYRYVQIYACAHFLGSACFPSTLPLLHDGFVSRFGVGDGACLNLKLRVRLGGSPCL